MKRLALLLAPLLVGTGCFDFEVAYKDCYDSQRCKETAAGETDLRWERAATSLLRLYQTQERYGLNPQAPADYARATRRPMGASGTGGMGGPSPGGNAVSLGWPETPQSRSTRT